MNLYKFGFSLDISRYNIEAAAEYDRECFLYLQHFNTTSHSYLFSFGKFSRLMHINSDPAGWATLINIIHTLLHSVMYQTYFHNVFQTFRQSTHSKRNQYTVFRDLSR